MVGLIALNLIPISEDTSLSVYYQKYFESLNQSRRFLLRIQLIRDFDRNMGLLGRDSGFIEPGNPSEVHNSLKTNCLQCHNRRNRTPLPENNRSHRYQSSSAINGFQCQQCGSPMLTNCCICLSPIHIQMETAKRDFPFK